MTSFSPGILDLASSVLESCRTRRLGIVTAESCTGGLIIGAMTAVPGSSDVVDRGFVTYTNEAKTEMLDVSADLIAAHGAVSEPVARAMAAGALKHSHAGVSIAVTGIAGPTGGTPGKPVGLVHIAAARRDGATAHERRVFDGDRDAVRHQTVSTALRLVQQLVREIS